MALADLVHVLEGLQAHERLAGIRRFVDGCDLVLLRGLVEGAVASSDLPEEVRQTMLRRLARDDASWTAEYLRTLPEGPVRAALLGTALDQWAESSLSTAVEWAKKLDDPALRKSALMHVSYRWYRADPVEALAYAALDPADNRQLLTHLVGLWSREQPEAAAAWAAEFSRDPIMAHVTASAVSTWAQQDGLAAAEFVLGLPEGPLRKEAAISVMGALARSDPDTGAAWVDAFPAGLSRDYAIENLVYGWASSDPDAALAWINRLPSAERDHAIFAGAGGLIGTRPELAAGWVMAITDEGRRLRQSERVARRWLQTDRWSAEAWIRRSSLPERTKLRLLASSPTGS